MRDQYSPGQPIEKAVKGYITCNWSFNRWRKAELEVITAFVSEVNRIAENNMIKTGKLEGSHHAAIRQLMERYVS